MNDDEKVSDEHLERRIPDKTDTVQGRLIERMARELLQRRSDERSAVLAVWDEVLRMLKDDWEVQRKLANAAGNRQQFVYAMLWNEDLQKQVQRRRAAAGKETT